MNARVVKKTFNETEVNMLNYCSKCARKKSTKNYKKVQLSFYY